MDHVASEKFGNFVGLRIILYVRFTYVVLLVEHVIILLNMFNVPSMTYATAGPW